MASTAIHIDLGDMADHARQPLRSRVAGRRQDGHGQQGCDRAVDRLLTRCVRSATFERRQIIVCRATPATVKILRVADARRDWTDLLSD